MAQFPQDLTQIAPLVVHQPQGERISVDLRFLDAAGKSVPSVIVETWQANARGRYRHPLDTSEAELDPQFDGFARLRTDERGVCTLSTVKPGAHQVGKATRAPHLRLTIFASGIDRLATLLFFPDEALNASDPVLNSISEPAVRERLIANRVSEGKYELTIVMRGEGETPFFEDPEDGDG